MAGRYPKPHDNPEYTRILFKLAAGEAMKPEQIFQDKLTRTEGYIDKQTLKNEAKKLYWLERQGLITRTGKTNKTTYAISYSGIYLYMLKIVRIRLSKKYEPIIRLAEQNNKNTKIMQLIKLTLINQAFQDSLSITQLLESYILGYAKNRAILMTKVPKNLDSFNPIRLLKYLCGIYSGLYVSEIARAAAASAISLKS